MHERLEQEIKQYVESLVARSIVMTSQNAERLRRTRVTLDADQFDRMMRERIRLRNEIKLGAQRIEAALLAINTTLLSLIPPEEQRIPIRAGWRVENPKEE